MSIHPSLGASIKHRKQKSVLKRAERLKILSEKGEWEEDQSVFGLPKVKTVKIKIKKEKVVKETDEAAVAGTEGAPEGGATPSEKPGKAEKPEKKSEKP